MKFSLENENNKSLSFLDIFIKMKKKKLFLNISLLKKNINWFAYTVQ